MRDIRPTEGDCRNEAKKLMVSRFAEEESPPMGDCGNDWCRGEDLRTEAGVVRLLDTEGAWAGDGELLVRDCPLPDEFTELSASAGERAVSLVEGGLRIDAGEADG